MNNTYYVYAYLRNKDSKTAKAGTPYYIGKGNGIRYKAKHRIPVPRDRTKIVFLERNLTELGAYAIERRMIGWYGRKDINTGILLNRTSGGEGGGNPPSRKGVVVSVEVRLQISKSLKGRPSPKKGKPGALKGRPSPFKGTTRIPAVPKGSKNPKVGDALRGRKQSQIVCPHCNKAGGAGAMKLWHFDNCKYQS